MEPTSRALLDRVRACTPGRASGRCEVVEVMPFASCAIAGQGQHHSIRPAYPAKGAEGAMAGKDKTQTCDPAVIGSNPNLVA